MNTNEFKEALIREKAELEETLSSVSKQNPKIQGDWEATYPDLNVPAADKNDMADEVEEYDNARGVNSVLEEKLNEINAALERIEQGTYGICEKGKEHIPEERLRANPSARTCVKHS